MAASRPQISFDTTTYKFVTLKGMVQPFGEVLRDITRPGANGQGYNKTGKRAEAFQMHSTRDVVDADAVKTAFINYTACRGELVTLTTEDQTTYSNVMVLDVRNLRFSPVTSVAGGLCEELGEGTATFIVEADWSFQLTQEMQAP